jgi:hypothetical protein
LADPKDEIIEHKLFVCVCSGLVAKKRECLSNTTDSEEGGGGTRMLWVQRKGEREREREKGSKRWELKGEST